MTGRWVAAPKDHQVRSHTNFAQSACRFTDRLHGHNRRTVAQRRRGVDVRTKQVRQSHGRPLPVRAAPRQSVNQRVVGSTQQSDYVPLGAAKSGRHSQQPRRLISDGLRVHAWQLPDVASRKRQHVAAGSHSQFDNAGSRSGSADSEMRTAVGRESESRDQVPRPPSPNCKTLPTVGTPNRATLAAVNQLRNFRFNDSSCEAPDIHRLRGVTGPSHFPRSLVHCQSIGCRRHPIQCWSIDNRQL